MKQLFNLLLCGIMVFAAVGCNEEPTPGENNGLPQLETPVVGHVVDLNNVTLTWSEIEGALYYTVAVNDEEPTIVESTNYVVRGLAWSKTHKLYVKAVSPNEKALLSSEPAVVEVTLGGRIAPAYREWYVENGTSATAISNNGRYVVGAYDRNGFILDLNTDILTVVYSMEFSDVSDDGVAVGTNYTSGIGQAAYYVDGQIHDIDITELISATENLDSASLDAITPDGKMAVGWIFEYGNTEYTEKCGMMLPIVYNFETEEVSILPVDNLAFDVNPYDPSEGVQIGVVAKSIAPNGAILGYDYSIGMFNIVWSAWNEPFEYVYLEKQEKNGIQLPLEAIGDSQNRMSQNGTYVYGKGKNYASGFENEYAGAYNLLTDELIECGGASITLMTDDGIAFINDAPYYMGETSYVVDTKGDDLETLTPIVDWLLEEYDLDLAEEIPYGVIMVAASEDGKTLVGTSNTENGWVSCVICLDGIVE